MSAGADWTRRPVDPVALEQRAAAFRTRSLKRETKEQGLRLAVAMTDLTTLEGSDSPEKVRSLCRKALRPDPRMPDLPPVAAVCVYPKWVALAKELVGEAGVQVASVASAFPSGQVALATKLADVREAVDAGADEIDMVIQRGAFLAGDLAQVHDEIAAIKEACGAAHLKVILETGELGSMDAIARASRLAIDAGADFIKTSTGKIQPAATMPVTLLMLETIRNHVLAGGRPIGMKPAGGIRTAKEALHYLVMVKETLGDAWLSPTLFRFGASSLLNDLLRQLHRLREGRYAARYDVTEA
ncbi:MAG: deoxyribose-phosphate aldolase [Planctomycetota bacterium]|jgi:deoxyribose-phosphate aldolase